MRMNTAAIRQVTTAMVSSQPAIRFHAGSVKRKKSTGKPKIGSETAPAACGVNQNSASVGHSPAMAPPVVVNRWQKGDQETLKSVEKNIKRPIFAFLPNDFRKASSSVNL